MSHNAEPLGHKRLISFTMKSKQYELMNMKNIYRVTLEKEKAMQEKLETEKALQEKLEKEKAMQEKLAVAKKNLLVMIVTLSIVIIYRVITSTFGELLVTFGCVTAVKES